MADTFRRRESPIDLGISNRDHGKPKVDSTDGNVCADRDYYKNLKQFHRGDDMAAEPTRNKGNESGQKP